MNGDLPQSNGISSQFIVWVIKDPIGAGLDRIQIIKGWMENGQMKEKINNVAVSDKRSINTDGTVEPLDTPLI